VPVLYCYHAGHHGAARRRRDVPDVHCGVRPAVVPSEPFRGRELAADRERWQDLRPRVSQPTVPGGDARSSRRRAGRVLSRTRMSDGDVTKMDAGTDRDTQPDAKPADEPVEAPVSLAEQMAETKTL